MASRRGSAAEEEEAAVEEAADQFDRLPDAVVLVVLNRVGDVKALGRCSAVSRRFHALVPYVDHVLVRVDCVVSDDRPAAPDNKPRGVLAHLARGLSRPLLALAHLLRRSPSDPSPSSSSSSDVSHHSPIEVLRSFKDLRRLRIELPAGELGVDGGALLKWRAGFGSTLDSCVILGASSVLRDAHPAAALPDDNGGIPDSFYTNGSLKLRVVWTISALVAAAARHFLLRPIVAEHEALESVELADADGQGALAMDWAQLRELRARPVSAAAGSAQRTLVPALSMRLWYVSRLELPGGVALEGATLVAIQPSEEAKEAAAVAMGGDGCWVANAFEEPYRTAARLLVKRRTYCLEMNSF